MMDLPVHLVLLVSEQLLPALEFALHVADRYGPQLQAINLYCTEDQRRSIEPAQRLERSLRRWLDARRLPTVIGQIHGSVQPDDVRAGLRRCFESAPDAHWLVNVTGGNKLMSAAAVELSLSTTLSSCRVIYREINGPWFELYRDDKGFLQTQTINPQDDADVPRADTLDQLMPVEDLVVAQFPGQHRCEANAVRSLSILDALDSVFDHGRWRWDKLYELLPEVRRVSAGDAFERFIAAAVESCGVRVRHSLKLLDVQESPEKPQAVREVDIVACHHGRLVCIDIKLPDVDESAKGTQLADIADLARQIGGAAAVAIALRPGWPAEPGVLRLARALRVHLLTQVDAPTIFSRLLAAIDERLPLPEQLKKTQDRLARLAQQGYSVLSDRRKAECKPLPSGEGWLNAIETVRDFAQNRQQGWALLLVPGGVLIWVHRKSPYHAGCNHQQCQHLVDELRKAADSNNSPVHWIPLTDGAAEFCGILKGSLAPRVIEQKLKALLPPRESGAAREISMTQ